MEFGGKHAPACEREVLPRVMVVEDEVLIRIAIADDLRDEGFEVLEAQNGDEALALLDGGVGVDVIFTDVNMPGSRDGLDLAETVTDLFPEISVILTSANEIVLDRGRLRHVPFLPKPYLPIDVVDLIRTQLIERDNPDAEPEQRQRDPSDRGRGGPRPA